MFSKILIANRGEIAIRIIRALSEMGIKSVAVYSEADKNSLHRFLADESICIGPGDASESYLRADRIISAAILTGAKAIHPGYGFLSENEEFAALCEENGIAFIGPSSELMKKLSDKTKMKEIAKDAGLDTIPGTGILSDLENAKKKAKEIGYPVMLKARSGGGGRGIRLITDEASLEKLYPIAKNEAEQSFSDGALYLEKYIMPASHIEVQVLADEQGNAVSFAERDCSMQRNHQKLIEESPSPAINDEIRNAMNRDAVLAAKTVNYTNAGTIEFILDPKGTYYFMEMNTRIQVEHGVTEMVTGTDLIIEQIRIAMGEPLSFNQEGIRLNGHAIECRINAEIPEKNFMPSPGVVKHLHLPAGNGVRVDTALYTGYRIPSEYDSMIAKVIVHAPDRNAAIQKMRSALDEMVIMGVETNLDFQYQIMRNPEFCAGNADTGFIERMLRLD